MVRALRRSASPPGNVEITARDVIVLRACYEFRLVSNRQLKRLAGVTSSDAAFNNRLRKLFDAGYLDRPRKQDGVYAFKNECPTLNALGQRGVDYLRDRYGFHFPKNYGMESANRALKSPTFMQHQLGLVSSYLCFRDNVGSHPDCRFIDKPEILELAPPKTQKRPRPWWIRTEFTDPYGSHVVRDTKPDYTLAIGHNHEGQERLGLTFIEFDNATVDFVRTDPTQSSITGMYLRYADIYRRKLHTAAYGFKNFRVAIVVAEDAGRLQRMQQEFRAHVRHQVPASLFIHTTLAQMEQQGIFAPIWTDGRGKEVLLLGA